MDETERNWSLAGEGATYVFRAPAHVDNGAVADEDWAVWRVECRAGCFDGVYLTSMRDSELLGLLGGLDRLTRELRGTHEFAAVEDGMSIRIEMGWRGDAQVRVVASPRLGLTLTCEFGSDQSFLTATRDQLRDALRAPGNAVGP